MNKIKALELIAKRLRIHSLQMTTRAKSGHPTTCLSSAELISCLFFDEMRYNIKYPEDTGNDEFILSKGHASPILWAAFAEARIIPFKDLESYRQINSKLEGHPTPRMPWIKYATGSLGQGLGIGLGMAEAVKIQKLGSRVYVMLGDGECAEGSVWEAAELATKLKTDNLTAIIDINRLGQSGESLHGHDIKKWKAKWDAFGWKTLVIDGHNIPQILNAFKKAKKQKGPVVILAKTLKGKGLKFLENREGWHGKPLNDEQLAFALSELGPMPDIDSRFYLNKPRYDKSIKHSIKKIPITKYEKKDLVATRVAFGKMLSKMGINEKVVAIDGDTKNSTYTLDFFEKYPQRSFECFIAEQNMISIAQGLSAKGLIPFAATFGAFFTRAHDQIRMAGIAGANINLVGSHVGVSIGEDGPSQMALEDISMMRSIPDSTVLYPSDGISAEALTELMINNKGINYLRTSRPKTSIIYKNNEKFKIGGSKTLLKGGKTVVIAAGITVHEALATNTKKKFTLIDAYSVKPLDKNLVSLCKGKKVIVVEDHYPEGGLAEAVMSLGIKVNKHLCVKKVSRSGSKEALMKYHGIDSISIKKAIESK